MASLSEVAAEVGLTTLLSEITVVDHTSPRLAFTRRHGVHSVQGENRLVLELPLSPSRHARDKSRLLLELQAGLDDAAAALHGPRGPAGPGLRAGAGRVRVG